MRVRGIRGFIRASIEAFSYLILLDELGFRTGPEHFGMEERRLVGDV